MSDYIKFMIMEFNKDKAIYLQIADRISEEILAGKYEEDSRIPSIREYAVMLEVNVNTVVKSYDLLSSSGIIANKRGLGYFVASEAKSKIRNSRKEDFMTHYLPELVKQMKLLGINVDEVVKKLQNLING